MKIFYFSSEDSNIIIQHMDIRQPLSTLRNLLHQRLNIDLNDYEFWLQDAQMVNRKGRSN